MHDEIAAMINLLHRAGWSIGSTAYGTAEGALAWAIDGRNGENLIWADGATEADAWHAAVGQARSLGMLGRGRAGPRPAQAP